MSGTVQPFNHPAGQPLSLRDKIIIGIVVGVAIGVVSAFIQHHATAYLQNGRKQP